MGCVLGAVSPTEKTKFVMPELPSFWLTSPMLSLGIGFTVMVTESVAVALLLSVTVSTAVWVPVVE